MAFLAMVVRTLRDHDESWPTSLDRDDFNEEEKASRDRLRQRWEDNRALIAHDVKQAAERVGLEVDERGYPKEMASLVPPMDGDPLLAMGDTSKLLGPLMAAISALVKKGDRDAELSKAVRADGTLRFRQIVAAQKGDGTFGGLFALDMEGELHYCALTLESLGEVAAGRGDDWNLRWSKVESRL